MEHMKKVMEHMKKVMEHMKKVMDRHGAHEEGHRS
jgi:hypothetical protein